MGYIAIRSVAHQAGYHLITASFPADATGATAAANWLEANDGNEIVEQSKDVYRDVLGGEVGFYLRTSDSAVVQFPPAPTALNADVNRGEVTAALRRRESEFRPDLLAAKHSDADQQKIVNTLARRARNLLAYADVDANLTAQARYDLLKAQADVSWYEFARFASVSGWEAAYADTAAAFYAWAKPSDGTALNSVGLPAADTTLTAPTPAAIVALDLLDKLA